MKTTNKILEYQTKGELDFIDITKEVKDFIKRGSIKNGLVNLQTFHTTCALLLNENEPLLLEDIKKNLRDIAPKSVTYNHDNFEIRTVNMCNDECANGHAHCKAIYLPSNLTLNLIDGKLQLGQWQAIFMVELDRSRKRTIQIQIMGD